MQVTVAVQGQFHAFHLAAQLQRRGLLHRLLTTDPRFRRFGVDPARVLLNPLPEIFQRWPWAHRDGRGEAKKLEAFAAWAARHIGEPDVVVAWSGAAAPALRRARERGALAVVERGSTHIAHQAAVLREEWDRFGVAGDPLPPGTVEREEDDYAAADLIAVPTRYVAETFVRRGFSPEQLLVAPYGVDVSHFRPSPKEDSVFRVVYAGGITFQKGIPYLIEAFRRARIPGAELLLIGGIEPDLEPFLARHRGAFRYMPRVPHLELYRHLSQGSVFCIASVQEGLAMVQAQAMACGLPVVATEATGAAEVLDDGVEGFIVPVRDVDAMAERFVRLHRDPELRETLGRAAAARAGRLTWERYADGVVEGYNSAMQRRGIR